MQIIMLLMVIVIAVFFSIQLLSLVTIFKSNQVEFPTDYAYPKVSLLLAARNEALLIERCLAAIDQLDYPKDKLEILIGDDVAGGIGSTGYYSSVLHKLAALFLIRFFNLVNY